MPGLALANSTIDEDLTAVTSLTLLTTVHKN